MKLLLCGFQPHTNQTIHCSWEPLCCQPLSPINPSSKPHFSLMQELCLDKIAQSRASYTLITSPLSWCVHLHENSADVWIGAKCGHSMWHHLLGFDYLIQSVMQSGAISCLGCKLLNPLKVVNFLRARYLTKCFLSFPCVCALKYHPVIIYSYTCDKEDLLSWEGIF